MQKKYSDKLTEKEVDELLVFEPGILDDKFPQKRLVIKRVVFTGVKSVNGQEEHISFDKELNEGLCMLMADNLKGKSSVFKIIKFALTGDNDIAVDIKSWLQIIHLEFKINDVYYTAFLNLEKSIAKATLFQNTYTQVINEEALNKEFESDSALSYKAAIQDFFFNHFQFYHLNWTQKSSQKDKNDLIESKASWNTYFESVYLTSRASTTLAYGNQEELIFQMLLGLKLTYPINRIKTRLEKTTFDLSKLREYSTREVRNKAVELGKLEKQFEKIDKELEKLKETNRDEIDLSKLYEQRHEITTRIDSINSEQAVLDNSVVENRRTINSIQNRNNDITVEGNRYKDLIKKAKKTKLSLEEHVQFGIFFSNLDIKVCPHCNTLVSDEKKKHEKEAKECMLCSHQVADAPPVSADSFQVKITSLDLEIQGYEKQLEILRTTYTSNKQIIGTARESIQQNDSMIKEIINYKNMLYPAVFISFLQAESIY